MQNLSYSAIQVIHNFGAVATVGGSIIASRWREDIVRKRLAHLVLFGWLTQAASGLAFGITTFYFYRHLPDITGVAIEALAIKMVCVALGISLLTVYLWQGEHWTESGKNRAWITSSALAAMAISAAAFLRWFS